MTDTPSIAGREREAREAAARLRMLLLAATTDTTTRRHLRALCAAVLRATATKEESE